MTPMSGTSSHFLFEVILRNRNQRINRTFSDNQSNLLMTQVDHSSRVIMFVRVIITGISAGTYPRTLLPPPLLLPPPRRPPPRRPPL